jgi:hypothetical protein
MIIPASNEDAMFSRDQTDKTMRLFLVLQKILFPICVIEKTAQLDCG